MDSLAHLRHMFAYEAWAQDAVLASLSALERPPERATKVFDHLLGAGTVWLARAWDELLAGLRTADLEREVHALRTGALERTRPELRGGAL